jgi:hypothetical protein
MTTVTTTEVVTGLPARVDVTQLAGQELVFEVPLLAPDGGPMPSEDVLTGRAQVRAEIDADDVLHEFSEANGLALLDEDGQLVIRLTASPDVTTEWQTLWPGRNGQAVVWWDLEITYADDLRTAQVTLPGTITLHHQVTL